MKWGSIWYHSEPLESPIPQTSFLPWTFFATSYSKTALIFYFIFHSNIIVHFYCTNVLILLKKKLVHYFIFWYLLSKTVQLYWIFDAKSFFILFLDNLSKSGHSLWPASQMCHNTAAGWPKNCPKNINLSRLFTRGCAVTT